MASYKHINVLAILSSKSVEFYSTILRYTTGLLMVNIMAYGFYRSRLLFLRPDYFGDEIDYLEDLNEANEKGISFAIKEGTSITFTYLGYCLDQLVQNPLLTLRIISLFSGISILFFLFYFSSRTLKLDRIVKYQLLISVLYLLVVQSSMFRAINDVLLALFGTILLMIPFFNLRNYYWQFVFIGLLLALMLATRKMAATYLIIYLFIFFICALKIKNHKFFSLKYFYVVIISSSIFFLLFNIQSIWSGNGFSFDDKILRNSSVNWAQFDYHNALLIDQGYQDRLKHIPRKETEEYIKKYGEASLPSNFFEMIYFKPSITIKEFFIDFGFALKDMFRQLGFLVFAFLLFFLKRYRVNKNNFRMSKFDFIYFFSLSYILFICFIVITNVQSRWFLVFIPVLLIIMGKDFSLWKRKEQIIFFAFNNLLLAAMNLPYIIKQIA